MARLHIDTKSLPPLWKARITRDIFEKMLRGTSEQNIAGRFRDLAWTSYLQVLRPFANFLATLFSDSLDAHGDQDFIDHWGVLTEADMWMNAITDATVRQWHVIKNTIRELNSVLKPDFFSGLVANASRTSSGGVKKSEGRLYLPLYELDIFFPVQMVQEVAERVRACISVDRNEEIILKGDLRPTLQVLRGKGYLPAYPDVLPDTVVLKEAYASGLLTQYTSRRVCLPVQALDLAIHVHIPNLNTAVEYLQVKGFQEVGTPDSMLNSALTDHAKQTELDSFREPFRDHIGEVSGPELWSHLGGHENTIFASDNTMPQGNREDVRWHWDNLFNWTQDQEIDTNPQ